MTDAFFKQIYVLEPNYCLYSEITAEAYTAYNTLYRLMLYFRNFRTQNQNTEGQSQPKNIHNAF